MDKMKQKSLNPIKNLNLIPSYVLLAVAFLLGAMFIADFERKYIEDVQMEVAQKYTDQVETYNDYKVWDQQGNVYTFTKSDSDKIRRMNFFYYIFPHMAYICSTMLASLVYYRIKLKEPLHILSDATMRIADSDLDFVVSYEKDDEMGQLCEAFELMRSSLEESNRETWRQMEDRKRLNASFSHDLRTLLTVLEGHMEMLQKYSINGALSEEDIREIYSIMDIQLKRMSRYVTSMSVLQRLEDIPISPKEINTEELVKALKNTAEIICGTKKLSFVNEIRVEKVKVDLEIVLQICENLLANAIRYAKSSVEIACRRKNRYLEISVSDDGKGFDEKATRIATDPFYTTENKSEGEHFGLGLNICKILCSRHGGSIILKNLKSGGACVTVTFGMR